MSATHDRDTMTKLADAAAGTSIAGFGLSLAAASEVVTLIAGIVAILAGLSAVWFHTEKALAVRQKRLRDQGESS